jgi:hypothetical protein
MQAVHAGAVIGAVAGGADLVEPARGVDHLVGNRILDLAP